MTRNTNGLKSKLVMVGMLAALIPITTDLAVFAQESDDAENQKAPTDSENPSLKDMIAKAVRNHPEVAAARAKLLEAQANLGRAKLEVAQRVVEYEKNRKSLQLSLEAEMAKLKEMRIVESRKPGSIPEAEMRRQEAAVEELGAERSAVESQLPYILGNTDSPSGMPTNNEQASEYAAQMLTHAKTGYEAASALYASGKTTQRSVELWSERWLFAEDAVRGKSPANAERHVARMQELLTTVTSQFEGGVSSKMGYASVQYSVAKAKRILSLRR